MYYGRPMGGRALVALLLVCAGVACATTTPSRTEVRARNHPPPPPPLPPPPFAPALADEIIKAQKETFGNVPEAFAPVSADLQSGDDRRVAAALEVVEAIGTRVDEMARTCPPDGALDAMLCGMSNIDRLVAHIAGALAWLRRRDRRVRGHADRRLRRERGADRHLPTIGRPQRVLPVRPETDIAGTGQQVARH
jgi:hypothetical protein